MCYSRVSTHDTEYISPWQGFLQINIVMAEIPAHVQEEHFQPTEHYLELVV